MDLAKNTGVMDQRTQNRQQKPALDCDTMEEVRAEIDRLDQFIAALLAERQTYIEAAARIKDSREAVRDPARIEEVISKVSAEAEKLGLSLDIAEPVWRTLMERSIDHEYRTFDDRTQGRKSK